MKGLFTVVIPKNEIADIISERRKRRICQTGISRRVVIRQTYINSLFRGFKKDSGQNNETNYSNNNYKHHNNTLSDFYYIIINEKKKIK